MSDSLEAQLRCPLDADAECPGWAGGPCSVNMARDCHEVWGQVHGDDGPTKAEAEDHRAAARWAADDFVQDRHTDLDLDPFEAQSVADDARWAADDALLQLRYETET